MSAAWLLGGAWGVARPATEVGGAALVSPETAGPSPFARFADELAHGNLARSIYTCEVPSFATTCTSIAGVQVDEARLILPPDSHLLLFGHSFLREFVPVLVAAHQRQGAHREHVRLDDTLVEPSEHQDCEPRSDRVATGAAEPEPVVSDAPRLASALVSGEPPALDETLCNVVSGAAKCSAGGWGNYERYTFFNGARLTVVLNYRPLQGDDAGTVERLRTALKGQNVTNAFVMPPHTNEYFDEHCKKAQNPGYAPARIRNRFACVHEADVGEHGANAFRQCATDSKHFKAISSLGIPKTMVVPWLYETGGKQDSEYVFYAGRVARQYDCAAPPPGGVGTPNTTHREHECVVVCEAEPPGRCQPGSVAVMAVELVRRTGLAMMAWRARAKSRAVVGGSNDLNGGWL
jgi:hypothetical protein